MAPVQSRRFATVVTIVVVFAFLALALAPAFAAPTSALPLHARLVSSAPAHKATVETVDSVVLTFNESVNPDFVAVKVSGPDGGEVDGDPNVDGMTVTQPLTSPLRVGKHTVTYRVVSNDGHPISGTLTFTTTGGAASASPSAMPIPSPTAEATPTVSETTTPASPTTTASPAASTDADAASADADGSAPWLGIGIGVAVAALAAVGGAFWRRSRESSAAPGGRTS